MPKPNDSNPKQPQASRVNKPPADDQLTPGFLKAITDLHTAVETLKSQLPPEANVPNASIATAEDKSPEPARFSVAPTFSNVSSQPTHLSEPKSKNGVMIVYGLVAVLVLIWVFCIFVAH